VILSTINRRPHVMKREKTLTIPRHFIFFDTETTPILNDDNSIRQVFKLGWACYYRRPYGRHQELVEWFFIDSPVNFWTFVFGCSQPKQKLWVIARNIVFDFTVLDGWSALRREGYKLKFFHNNGVTAIVSVRKKGSSIVFLDSLNWFVESIEKTGERIGISKMKIDFETCTREELSIYCKNDALIDLENFKLFIKFLETNRISRLCYTRASTAMAAYLFSHYHTPIYIHNNAQAIKLERESYKGGRCECFYLGELENDTYYIVDVNSLYPFVMREFAYPVRYRKIIHQVSRQELQHVVENNAVVAKVRIKTEEPVYAVKRKRTIFPVGKYITTLCTPELKYALEHNHIKDVIDLVVYEQANIFTSYVTSFYTMRQEFKADNNKQYDTLCKYLMNSLYGKFGQKGEQWVKTGDAPNEPDREEIIFRTNPRMVTRLRYLLGEVFELKGYNEAFDSFPAIAAHVTAFGRMYLWELMQQAGEGNYFYCDTDSLIVNKEGLCRLRTKLNTLEIGYLKLEQESDSVILRGLKDYSFGIKNVTKGIRRNATKINDSTFKQQTWPSFKGLLQSGYSNTYVIKETVKHLSREYTKGNVTETGQVTPFILSEI